MHYGLAHKHKNNFTLQGFSEALKNPIAFAGSIMSHSERQVANVLGPQAFVGITGASDTLGNIKNS